MNTRVVALGEYNTYIQDRKDGKIYDVSGGAPTLLAGQPPVIVSGHASLHHAAFIDGSGGVWVGGTNQCGISGDGSTTDFAGCKKVNLPLPAIQVVAYNNGGDPGGMGSGCAALLSDGSVIIWGNTQSGFTGDGSPGINASLPVRIPGLPIIKKIQGGGVVLMALDETGIVRTWGAGILQWEPPFILGQGTDTPNKSMPAKLAWAEQISDIIGGSYTNYAITVSGKIIGWAYQPGYLGLQNTPAQNAPFDLTNTLKLQAPIKKLVINNMVTLALLTDQTLWAWGDNAQGNCGNGTEDDMSQLGYAWPWTSLGLMQYTPVQVGKGVPFFDVWGGIGDVFYVYAEDVNEQLYSWGRNKAAVVAPFGGSPDDESNRPNSWDVPYITAVDPWAITGVIFTPSPASMSSVALPSIPLTCSAGAAQTIPGPTGQLHGSSNGTVNYWKWKQVSGPNQALIVLPTSQAPLIQGLISGIYVFQLSVTDNYWRTAMATISLTVAQVASAPRKVISVSIIGKDGQSFSPPIADCTFKFNDGSTQ